MMATRWGSESMVTRAVSKTVNLGSNPSSPALALCSKCAHRWTSGPHSATLSRMSRRRSVLSLVVGLALIPAPAALAQDTTTSTLGDYTSTTPTTPTTTPTETVPGSTGEVSPTTTTGATGDTPSEVGGEGEVLPTSTTGATTTTPATSVAGTPSSSPVASTTPDSLAFTGAEPILVGLGGLLLMGLALLMQRRRRDAR